MPRRPRATAQETSTELAVQVPAALQLTEQEQAQLDALDVIENQCTLQAISSISSQAERSIVLAKAMKMAIDALEPFRGHIEYLKGSPLGYQLDKPEEYDWPLLKRVIAEGMLKGARITGNEINGIGKRCYLTQAYFVRKVREWPGVVVQQELFSVPRQHNGQTVVDAKIDYTINGEEQSYTREGNTAISIRVNAGMGPDAIIGKARRKAYAGLLDRLIARSGNMWSPGADAEVGETDGPAAAITAAPQAQAGSERINVQAWTARVNAATTRAGMAGVGRELVDSCNLRHGIWSANDMAAFQEVLTLYIGKRLDMATTADDIDAIEAMLNAINQIRRIPAMDDYTARIQQARVIMARSRAGEAAAPQAPATE